MKADKTWSMRVSAETGDYLQSLVRPTGHQTHQSFAQLMCWPPPIFILIIIPNSKLEGGVASPNKPNH